MKIVSRPFKIKFFREIDGEKVYVPQAFWSSRDECLILDNWDTKVESDPLIEAKAVLEYIMDKR